MKSKQYQASFTVESVFLVSVFCIVICYFLFCVIVQYDLVILQTNKIYMQYNQMSEVDMEENADRGCLIFRAGNCEQKEEVIKTKFEIMFYVKNKSFLTPMQSMEAKMCGEWERMSVTEEIRLANVCMDLLQ